MIMACSNNACALTAGSGNSKGLENAMASYVKGKLESKIREEVAGNNVFSLFFVIFVIKKQLN